MTDVEEAGAAKGYDGGTNVWVGDYLDAEDVCDAAAEIVAEKAGDEDFSFLVKDEEGGNHVGGSPLGGGGGKGASYSSLR